MWDNSWHVTREVQQIDKRYTFSDPSDPGFPRLLTHTGHPLIISYHLDRSTVGLGTFAAWFRVRFPTDSNSTQRSFHSNRLHQAITSWHFSQLRSRHDGRHVNIPLSRPGIWVDGHILKPTSAMSLAGTQSFTSPCLKASYLDIISICSSLKVSSWWLFTNPIEKYESKWVHLPQFSGWKYKIFELPPPQVCYLTTQPQIIFRWRHEDLSLFFTKSSQERLEEQFQRSSPCLSCKKSTKKMKKQIQVQKTDIGYQFSRTKI